MEEGTHEELVLALREVVSHSNWQCVGEKESFKAPCTKGLDVHAQTLNRFAAQGDEESVKVLEVIYTDEITHVAAGLKWFTHICAEEERDPLSTFHELVPLYFKGYLKPPFNTEGRQKAGMTEEWYLPLVKPTH